MIECYCLNFFTTNKDTLQVTFPSVLCCCPYCWKHSLPFEPAGFLYSRIKSFNHKSMISLCWLNFLTTVLIVKQINCLHYSFFIMHFPFYKPWVTVDAPIDNLGYPKENQRPPHAKGHSYIIFWQMKVKFKINKWIIIWTFNRLKVLLYQMQVPLDFLLTIVVLPSSSSSPEPIGKNILSTRHRWWWELGRLINRGVRTFLNRHYEEVRWLTIWMFIVIFSR